MPLLDPPADLATVKVISKKMGKNEDLLVSGFGVEYGIDIVVFAGDDDVNLPLECDLETPTQREIGEMLFGVKN